MMNNGLHIGDKTLDDSLVVLDEDKLCYCVRSVSNGAVGVRTISKALLAEWVEAYKKTPNASAQDIRAQLVGKSEIDRFEYGYASTLAKMAKMSLGQISIISSVVKECFQDEFMTWWCDTKKRAEKTARNYIGYLASLNKSIGEKTNSTWPGVYVYLFGSKSPKEVVQIGTLNQFDEMFGPFCRIFDDSGCPEGANPNAYAECVQWVKDVSQWACLSSAFKAYREFLEWRETQKKSEDKKDELPPNVDRLSVALKLFAEKRYESEWQGCANKEGFLSIFDAASLKPADIAALTLDDFYKEFLLKVWAFTNGGSRRYGQLDDAAKVVYRDFVVRLKTSLESFDNYFPPNTKCPDGMGVGVLSELLMRFWPGSCCSYNKSLIHEGLVAVGMAEGDFVWPKTPSIYQEFMGKCAVILRKMEEMNLPRKPIPGNEESPDYITVNEFLWFASENKNLIKEKVMSKQWKSVNSKDKIKKGTRKLSEALSGNDMLKRLVAALRTKPFAILAGHSGTGKSQLVRRLAYMTCNNELLIKEGEGKTAPGNYCMVQVKPNWHDSTDLLGYYSEMGKRHFVNTPFVEFICKAYAYPDTPFFVCLDEMNLAPVEQYFAEYLSAIESMENKDGVWLTDPLVEVDKTGEKDASGKEKVDVEIVDQIMKGAASKEAADWIQAHGLTIPKNLFVVGTVNMDETTCQFSRKVLDRAMTLLMNDVKFSDMGASKKPSDEELLDEAGLDFFLEGEERGTVGAAESALLDGINEPLANTPFVVAYRFANEYALYEAALAKLNGVDLAAANDEEKKNYAMEALDHVVMMKLLPRIHGERGTVRVLFEGGKRGDKNVPGLESKLPSGGLSVDMMKKILERRDEYLTFWP